MRIVHRDAGAVLGVEGPLAVACTFGPRAFEIEPLTQAIATVEKLRATSHRELLAYVYIATASSALPDARARRMAARLGELVDFLVGIHEGDGFRVSTVRAVVTGMALMARRGPWPYIVGTAAEAAAWLAPHLGGAMTVAEIRTAIEQLRKQTPTG